MKTLVFGYSDNPERYSYKASVLLEEYGHEVIKFNPRFDDLKNLNFSFHTLALYVNPQISNNFFETLVSLKVKRVIFNPGTENENLQNALKLLGVDVIIGCTLVMLRTNQF
jgi:predicted CoA-binding protein